MNLTSRLMLNGIRHRGVGPTGALNLAPSRNMWLASIPEMISNCSAVQLSMHHLISLHQWLHVPWYLEISLVTLAARTLVAFPLTVNQRKIILRYEALKPEILAISKNLKQKMREESYVMGFNKSKQQSLYRKNLSKEITRLIQRDNCHPIKASLVALFQIPFWITLSYSYRNLANLKPDPNSPLAIQAHQQLSQEGVLWFQNLTLPDPTGILPITTALINLTIIQIHVNERKKNGMQDAFLIKLITNGGRLLSIAMIPIGLVMPANMSFYWVVSSSFGLMQSLLLINPRVKQLLQIDKAHVNRNHVKSEYLISSNAIKNKK